MKRFFTAFTIGLFVSIASFAQKKETKETNIFPGKEGLDSNGKHINAHSGGILFFNGLYYWHGEYNENQEGLLLAFVL